MQPNDPQSEPVGKTDHPSAEDILAHAQNPPLIGDDGEVYDYTIDPLQGLPEIETPEELTDAEPEGDYKIGRGPAPDYDADDEPEPVRYRATASDPVFGYVIAMAVSFGLTPVLPDGAPMRYTVAWGLLAGFGVMAWLVGNGERIGQERPDNLVWGVVVALLVGTPLYLFGGQTLHTTALALFDRMTPGALLAYLVFVMPLGETLFFRGLLQPGRGIWLVGGLSTAWSALLFFPLIRNLTEFTAVIIFIGTMLAIVNVVYSWVKARNGLAAAWLCQIVMNLILIFLPFISQ
jgi:membrane protease YdiL (CAAX protease family)